MIPSLIATVSHEFRTPLSAILGLNQLVLDTPLEPDQRELLTTVYQAAAGLLHLVNDILDFSAMGSQELHLECKPFSLTAVVQQCVRLLDEAAATKGLDLLVSEGELPSDLFLGDPVRLGQILTNLLSNALKFTKDGFILVSVEVGPLRRHGHPITLRVTDSGIGIPRSRQRAIFEPFNSRESARQQGVGGVGLGLAISRRLAERMGGKLRVSSRRGAGSTFTLRVYLPPAPALVPVPQPRSPALASGLRVLIAEDNALNQQLLRRQLEQLGCQVVTASDGQEALIALRRQPIDLLLMDCYLPRCSGIAATARIRQWKGKKRLTPVIVLTASALESDVQRCLAAGANQVLFKPVPTSELAALLGHYGPARGDSPDPELLQLIGAERERLIQELRLHREQPERLAETLHALAGIFLVLGSEASVALVRAWERLSPPKRTRAWEEYFPQVEAAFRSVNSGSKVA